MGRGKIQWGACRYPTVYVITFGSGKQLFPGLTATGINSVRGALPVEIIDRSSRIPGALSGLRPRERERGGSEEGGRKQRERERERHKELDRECVKEREIGDR